MKHSVTVLAPAANTTNIDYELSLIFLLLAVYDNWNNDQYRVNTQDQEPIGYYWEGVKIFRESYFYK